MCIGSECLFLFENEGMTDIMNVDEGFDKEMNVVME